MYDTEDSSNSTVNIEKHKTAYNKIISTCGCKVTRCSASSRCTCRRTLGKKSCSALCRCVQCEFTINSSTVPESFDSESTGESSDDDADDGSESLELSDCELIDY